MSIPKILHYCWFGQNEMPRIEAKCIKRFTKYFSDYKIICWDESNFNIEYNQYVKEAYDAGKYAYVSDVCRLKALYDYGGVYLDADCKVIKPFDGLLNCHAFTGFGADNREIAACTLAFEKGNTFIRECLDSYENSSFVKDDGTFDTYSVNRRMTAILEKHGFIQNGKKQIIDDIIIYPMTYFCPLSMLPDEVSDCKSKNTYSMAQWSSKELKRERSFPVRFAHKTRLNLIKRKIKEGFAK